MTMCTREHLAETIATAEQRGLAMVIQEYPGHKEVTLGGHPRLAAHFVAEWCIDCDETNPALFTVHQPVREEAGLPDPGICCITCFARRLPRRMTSADFTTSRANILVLAGIVLGRDYNLDTKEPVS